MALGTVGALVAGSIGSSVVGAVASNAAANAQADAAQAANNTQLEIFDRTVDLTEPNREAGQNALAAMLYEMGLGPRPMVGAVAPEITTRTIDAAPVALQHPGLFGGGPNENGIDSIGGGGPRPAPVNEYLVNGQVFSTMEDAQAYADANMTGGTPYQGYTQSPGYQYQLEQGQNALARMAGARGMRLSGNTLMSAMQHGQGLAAQDYGDYYNRLASMAGLGQTATGQQIAAGQNYANAYGNNMNAIGGARASGYQGINNAIQGGIGNYFNILGMQNAGFLI